MRTMHPACGARRLVVFAVLGFMGLACGADSEPQLGGSTGADSGQAQSDGADTGGSESSGSSSGLVANAGFEQQVLADGELDFTAAPDGWRRYDPGSVIDGNMNVVGVLNPNGTALFPEGAPEGDNVALVFLWNTQTDGIPAGIAQRLSTQLTVDTQYTLRVQVGNIAASQGAPYDLDGFPGYRIELVAGSTVLVADDNTLAPSEGEFELSELTFTASASDAALGEDLEIRLINLSTPESGIEVNFDDVELELTAPQ